MIYQFFGKWAIFAFAAFLIFSSEAFAQITFERGEIVFDSGQRLECYIKNMDWNNNPVMIEYKLTEDSETLTGDLSNIKEFLILEGDKFVRAEVNIDVSKQFVNVLDYQKDPVFERKTIFLKSLIEGETSLFYFEGDGLTRFFIRNSQGEVIQLIYKKYKSSHDRLSENEQYKNQLFDELKCSGLVLEDFKKLDYRRLSLMSIFEEYYGCSQKDYKAYSKVKNRPKFYFAVRPGVVGTQLESIYPENATSTFKQEGYSWNYRLGVEAEYFLPFNKNKWSVFLEPTFLRVQTRLTGRNQILNLNYTSMEIPVGVRYYQYVSKSLSIYANGFGIFDFPINSHIEFDPGLDYKISSLWNFGFGLGVKIKDKISVEGRYHSRRNLVMDDYFFLSYLKSFSFVIGYKLN